MQLLKSCPVCESPYTLFVQNVIGRRTGREHRQYVCLDCRSFFNPSGYKEPDSQQEFDFEFLFNQRERHSAILNQLALEILTKVPGSKTYCEIGFDSGFLMKSFNNFGYITYGFELNPYCVKFAREDLNLECEKGIFDESHNRTYDFIAAVMVFEHLERPRELFSLMKSKLNRDGAIYLSVPFAHRNDWRFLWTADNNPGQSPPDIFYDNDVHITHFSVEGMKQMGGSLGARASEYWVSKDVYDNSPGSYHGVLFRF